MNDPACLSPPGRVRYLMMMLKTARVLAGALVTGTVAGAVALHQFAQYDDRAIAGVLFGCAGAIVGAIATGTGEAVAALHRRKSRRPAEVKSSRR